MDRRWLKLPPVMQRTFADDLRWAAVLVTGALFGWLVSGADDISLLVWFVVSAVLVIAVLTAVRRIRRP